MDRIFIGEGNVRTRNVRKNLNELKDSIQRIGLLQPVVVMIQGDKYDLIVGQRRYLAAKDLGWTEIPALVVGKMDPIRVKIVSLSENLQRKSISYRDMVDACDVLYDKYGSIKSVAQELGVSGATVQTYLSHRIVPEPIKVMVEEGKLTRPDAIKVTNAMLSEIVEGHVEKAVMLAEEIAKMTREEKKRAVEIASDEPELEAREISKKARQPPIRTRITIHLPGRYRDALKNASKDVDMDQEDVAKTAVIEWLTARGYTN